MRKYGNSIGKTKMSILERELSFNNVSRRWKRNKYLVAATSKGINIMDKVGYHDSS